MDDVTPLMLLQAYASGIFPMAPDADSTVLEWFRPDERGVLPLDGMRVPRKLARLVRSGRFRVSSNRVFERVIQACAASAPGRETTWISARIHGLYSALHHQGHAHSVEVWDGDVLAGGLYGVSLGGAFFGESMFSRERDASKVALVHLVAGLRKGGFTLLDTQYTTPHLASLGGIGIPADTYDALLDKALSVPAAWPDDFSFQALFPASGIDNASSEAPEGDIP